MASNVSWDPSVPSGTSSIAQGDDDIRSFKSFMEAAWEDEHYFTDGSDTSAGEHKVGSARAYQAASSAMSNPRVGAIFHSTTDNNLYVASGSSYSAIIGTAVNSVNTWTAKQVFTGNVVVGTGGSQLSNIQGVKAAMAQVVLASSATTYFALTNSSFSGYAVSCQLRASQDDNILYSIHHDIDNDFTAITIQNVGDSVVTLSAQSVQIVAIQLN